MQFSWVQGFYSLLFQKKKRSDNIVSTCPISIALCMRELIKFGFGLKACFLYQAGEINRYFIKNRRGLLKPLSMRSFTCHLFTTFQTIERVLSHVITSLLPISACWVFYLSCVKFRWKAAFLDAVLDPLSESSSLQHKLGKPLGSNLCLERIRNWSLAR